MAMQRLAPGGDSPAMNFIDITPNDSLDVSRELRAIYVGSVGDVVAVDEAGHEVTFVGVSGVLPIRAIRIKATNTTASAIVGLF